jgi:hypothetical protein
MLAAVPLQNAQMLVVLLCAINGTNTPFELTATDVVISSETSGYTLCRQELRDIEERIPLSQIFSGFQQKDINILLPTKPICGSLDDYFHTTLPDLAIPSRVQPPMDKTAGVIAQDLIAQ